MVEDTNSGEDAVVRKVGVNGRESVHGNHKNGSLHGRRKVEGDVKMQDMRGTLSHRSGRGLRWRLRLCHCRKLHLGLGLSRAGWGGPLGWGWDRAREGGSGAATGGLGVRHVSGPPNRGGRGGCRRWRGVQGVLGGG